MRYRIVEKEYADGDTEYRVQGSFLFGLPLTWYTMSYWSCNPPHPDLLVPTLPTYCEVSCVFGNLPDAMKCVSGFMSKPNKVVKRKVIYIEKK